MPEDKRIWEIDALQQKAEETGRTPKKEDFDETTRARIKAFLGPWPRALEAAGLKEAKPLSKNKKKKRSKPAAKRGKAQNDASEAGGSK